MQAKYAPMPGQGPMLARTGGHAQSILVAGKGVQYQPAGSPYDNMLSGAEMIYVQPPCPGGNCGHGPDMMGPMGPVGPLPTELAPVSHGPYTVAPPDILRIETGPLYPRSYQIQPFDVVEIFIFQPTAPTPDLDPTKKGLKEPLIGGDFRVTPEGIIMLPVLGAPTAIKIGGMTIEQATKAIHDRLSQALKNVDVFVNLKQYRQVGPMAGDHLVRPDGTINLGTYGYLYVAGMTLGQIKTMLEKHLEKYVLNPSISVDVKGYNSKKYYLNIDGGGYGQLVFAYPYTGNEMVLDAVSRLQGLPWWASKKKIWVARPAPCDHPCSQILPVDWNAITQGGVTCTNWQIMPGDRVYVRADALVTANNWITKVLNPVNQILNTTLLGATTVNTISGTNTGSGGTFIAVP
jgi:polysaccharide export outer membrane protein